LRIVYKFTPAGIGSTLHCITSNINIVLKQYLEDMTNLLVQSAERLRSEGEVKHRSVWSGTACLKSGNVSRIGDVDDVVSINCHVCIGLDERCSISVLGE
jgi:hypothetical protein